MIGYISGNIIALDGITLTIIPEGNSIGYDVLVSPGTIAHAHINSPITLWIHHHRTDTSETLFGFMSTSERGIFRNLLRVSGIGGKTALTLLGLGSDTLQNAIITENITILSGVPGIGKKTAQKIILELRGSLATLAPSTKNQVNTSDDDITLISSLVSMGYDKTRVEAAIHHIDPTLPLSDRTRAIILKLAQ